MEHKERFSVMRKTIRLSTKPPKISLESFSAAGSQNAAAVMERGQVSQAGPRQVPSQLLKYHTPHR